MDFLNNHDSKPRRNPLHGSLAFCTSAQAKSPAGEPRLLHFSPGEIPCRGAPPSAFQPRRNPLHGSLAFCISAQAKSPAREPRLLHFSPGEITCTGAAPAGKEK
ncbi:PREDICTED: uncharacterized protein LOC107531059 isoform X4 [Miniopterus natalensis]|uniref:uncharacterized protein LOC107531059 isoform X4 n=1 Tax=Miniopterus natalensis TaxID=291302 RepID=UPI0007A70582|nr:PREDICTED: uncharacterized protein LOC107531059 isoform X4 [Miniopterus natalensis]